ncbi:MAG: DMT family transporter [Betaproteobacteria bacterium]|nr:DMT family transporter [Betaproteobacteria bacterium]MDH3438017.1 DMT family transporter [Betaproteobacteria bacterium]
MASEPTRMPVAVRAALWMGGALLSFALMAVSVRELLHTMGSFEVLFLRSVVSLLIMLAILPRFGGRALLTQRFGLHVVRNVLHFGGQYAWVYAIGALPLATVFAIEFTMPVWTAVLATFILGERLNRGRVVMLVMGLVGILIILKPGFQQVPPAALVMLAGSFAYASTMIATKRLAGHETVFAVLFYMAAIQVPLGLVFALPIWVTPGLDELPWIIAVGATGLSAHMCLTRAFRIADATLVVPFDFLRLPLIAVVGMLFYGEAPEAAVFLGAAAIFAGTYYSIRRESRHQRTVNREM